MNKEEMLEIFLEESGTDRSDVIDFKVVSRINESIANKAMCLKRKILFVEFKTGYGRSTRLWVSDKYPLVEDSEENG